MEVTLALCDHRIPTFCRSIHGNEPDFVFAQVRVHGSKGEPIHHYLMRVCNRKLFTSATLQKTGKIGCPCRAPFQSVVGTSHCARPWPPRIRSRTLWHLHKSQGAGDPPLLGQPKDTCALLVVLALFMAWRGEPISVALTKARRFVFNFQRVSGTITQRRMVLAQCIAY